jgi:hypothetical protein
MALSMPGRPGQSTRDQRQSHSPMGTARKRIGSGGGGGLARASCLALATMSLKFWRCRSLVSSSSRSI